MRDRIIICACAAAVSVIIALQVFFVVIAVQCHLDGGEPVRKAFGTGIVCAKKGNLP